MDARIKREKISMVKKQVIIVALILFTTIVTFTYAYFTESVSGETTTDVNIEIESSSVLKFSTGDQLNILANRENFTLNHGSLYDKSVATISYYAVDDLSIYYNVLFNVGTNEFVYSSDDKKPEVVLMIKDPDGNIVTEVEGLEFVTTNSYTVYELDEEITEGLDDETEEDNQDGPDVEIEGEQSFEDLGETDDEQVTEDDDILIEGDTDTDVDAQEEVEEEVESDETEESLPANKYVDVDEIQGFDITDKIGVFNIALGYEAIASKETIHEWTFTLYFVNLETSQDINIDKEFSSNVILEDVTDLYN